MTIITKIFIKKNIQMSLFRKKKVIVLLMKMNILQFNRVHKNKNLYQN